MKKQNNFGVVMIDLTTYEVIKSESSSKGNQLKFYNNGYWIKLDSHNCYEGLAEDFVSKFLQCIYDFNFVTYTSDKFVYNDEIYTGCYSYNMYNDLGINFVSLRHLFRGNGVPLNIFIKEDDTAKNILNVLNEVFRLTSVDISKYLFDILLLDALILNEDRHYMNLGVVTNGVEYANAQCFDNGSSLFCTNWTYRKTKSLGENIKSARSVARPFSKFFDKQVDACISLGAQPLVINKRALDSLMMSYNNAFYSDELNTRIKCVLSNRLAYYYEKGVYIYV